MLYFTGNYAKDRLVILKILNLFGNLTIAGLMNLINGSRTMHHGKKIYPLDLSFGCHLGDCNLPGDGVQILTARKDCKMNISDSPKKENIIADLLNDLYLSLFVLTPTNPEEIRRFREKGLVSLSEVWKFINEKNEKPLIQQ